MFRMNKSAIQDQDLLATTGKEMELTGHPAWHGSLTGVSSEALLKGLAPYTYLLRTGEEKGHFYISFVKEDLSIKHQPFVLRFSLNGWHYQNTVGAYRPTNVADLIPLMMHCEIAVMKPLSRL